MGDWDDACGVQQHQRGASCGFILLFVSFFQLLKDKSARARVITFGNASEAFLVSVIGVSLEWLRLKKERSM